MSPDLKIGVIMWTTYFNVLDYVTFSAVARSSESGKWLKNKILRSLLFQKITTPMECTSNHQPKLYNCSLKFFFLESLFNSL